MTDPKKFKAALKAIAAVFTEEYEYEERDGTRITRNRWGFVQDRVLNGVCYQLANTIDYSVNRTLPNAQARLKRALRADDGTEIAQGELEAASDWVERLQLQIAEMKEALGIATAVYEDATGTTYHYGRRPAVGSETPATPARERAAKLLGATTNPASTYNSNREDEAA